MKMIFSAAASAAMILSAGCSLIMPADRSEPALYDLSASQVPQVQSEPVVFSSFTDLTGNGLRIAFRQPEGKVFFDDCSRFSAPPGQLIRRRFTELFPPSSSQEPFRVSGVLTRFEADRESRRALMTADYHITRGGTCKVLRHRMECGMKEDTPAAAAAALEKCVINSARRLGRELSALKKKSDGIKEKK